ncbi:MAG: PDZ domain-containing protein, partial [Acetobacteraceae bacterium]
NENYNDCMEATGWRVADEQKLPPSHMTAAPAGEDDGAAHMAEQTFAGVATSDQRRPRRMLGIRVMPVTESLVSQEQPVPPHGLAITAVTPGEAAFSAGLRAGDVVLAFNGSPIYTASDLQASVSAVTAGSTATAEVWRNHRERTVQLRF